MEHYRRRKVPLMGDYEHQTDSAAMGFGITIAPASITEMTPEIRADQAGQPELWVKDVKWTARAQGMLEAGEYRLFSPTFGFDKGTREVTALLRIALTNDPSMDNLQPLVAASSAGAGADDETTEEEDNETMATESGQGQVPLCQMCASTKAHLADISKAHEDLGKQHSELLSKHAALTARLKSFETWAAEEVAEHGDDDETSAMRRATAGETPDTAAQLSVLGSISKRLKAQKALLAEVATLTGAKGNGEIVGTLTAWKGNTAELATLKSKVAADETARLTAEYNEIANKAVAAGKLTPATKAIGDGLLKSHDLATARAFLTSVIGTVSVTTVGNETKQPNPDQEVMSELEVAHCKASCIPFDQYLASRKRIQGAAR